MTSRTARSRHNALSRYRADDDPELLAAKSEMRAEALANYIERVAAEAPPLSLEQRERLAVAILRGNRAGAA